MAARQSTTPEFNTFQMSALHDAQSVAEPPTRPRSLGTRPSSSDEGYVVVPDPQVSWISGDEEPPAEESSRKRRRQRGKEWRGKQKKYDEKVALADLERRGRKKAEDGAKRAEEAEMKAKGIKRPDTNEDDEDGGVRLASTPPRPGSPPRITDKALERLLEEWDDMMKRISMLEVEVRRWKARATELERAQIEAAKWKWTALVALGVLAAAGVGEVAVRMKR